MANRSIVEFYTKVYNFRQKLYDIYYPTQTVASSNNSPVHPSNIINNNPLYTTPIFLNVPYSEPNRVTIVNNNNNNNGFSQQQPNSQTASQTASQQSNTNDKKKKKEEKEESSTTANVLTSLGLGVIAAATTYAYSLLYNNKRRFEEIDQDFNEIETLYRSLVPQYPYINSIGYLDVRDRYKEFRNSVTGTFSTTLLVGTLIATGSAGVTLAARFNYPTIGYMSYASLIGGSCYGWFDYLTRETDPKRLMNALHMTLSNMYPMIY